MKDKKKTFSLKKIKTLILISKIRKWLWALILSLLSLSDKKYCNNKLIMSITMS